MSDIGIIKLATPIEKSDNIEYASLPTSDAVPDGSAELTAVGWGRNISWTGTKGDAVFTVANRAEVLLEQQPISTCESSPLGDTSTLICAGKPGKTVCSGDSGGPLIDSKTGAVVGLTSISERNDDGSACTGAGIFTRVGSYLDFINENLGERGFTDGDNQRVKDEAKLAVLRPGLLASCKKHFQVKYSACMNEATRAFFAGKDTDKSKVYDQEEAKCKAIHAMGSACDGCVREAKLDSTAETIIQCSEAGKN
ncbi:Serine/cysteine peptidase, trypsin-like protein [Cordyceps militaris CM01]|uniref:Serine/cysteine peptidase, trypsin-like protein n=1 Tax=Cordyceps militaris (strain CM01) TaxID=983644 RepID=G3JHH4_CORMM|nr:Serine/cysteine peptidase, trypsin-like protein [Cordyceps militaris CM01]EGX90882.1 Serine/cysteine peptidase, trypsin-like protein [Cordyceps militaris CM01]